MADVITVRDVLHFSFPEVESTFYVPFILDNDPAQYRNFLVKSIKLFIAFMVKYVKDHKSEPDLVPMIEAFLRRMEAKWADFSNRNTDSSWTDYDAVQRSTGVESINKKVIADTDFHNFSIEFYKLIKDQGSDVMHDLNKLISIVLLGGFKNISYYIGEIPANIPSSAVIIRDRVATRIDMRNDEERRAHPTFFTQILRDPGESWSIKNADLFIFPLFVELAAVIVKHPELSEQFADSDAVNQAVDEAVDKAVADATAKRNLLKFEELQRKKKQAAGKRRKRTRHAHSGHKKRSGHNKRSSKRINKRMSRRR